MNPKSQRVQDFLDSISKNPGVVSATLLTRDGLLVQDARKHLPSATITSAMAASFLAAAELAFLSLAHKPADRVIVESEQGVLLACGAGADHALLIVLEDPARVRDAINAIHDVLLGLQTLLAEA